MQTNRIPNVAILLATYNGVKYLTEQIQSIAMQEGIEVTLIISDDCSSDGTLTHVKTLCEKYALKHHILSGTTGFGSAGKNFFRLIKDVDLEDFDYFAFADQDDIWHPNKLKLSLQALGQGVDAVSSDVTAFWSNGTKKNIIKSQPQTRIDYLFEAAGPGCTYVLTGKLFREIQLLVRQHESLFLKCALHDWAVYAVTRGLGFRWEILPMSTMLYRQHSSNVFGASKGFSALTKRIKMISRGWMYDQVLAIANTVEQCCPNSAVGQYKALILHPTMINRIKLCLSTPNFRRKKSECLLLAIIFLSGLFWCKKISSK